jgi:glycerol-3-phosphate dehydrogenase (NAD(P)+)
MSKPSSLSGKKKLRIAVLGNGAWGTALACVSARNGNETRIWGRDQKIIDEINNNHTNYKYLPDIQLPDQIFASSNLAETLANIDLLLLVTPAQSIQSVSETIRNFITPNIPLIVCAKGIDRQTGLLPAETLANHLSSNAIAALSGPSFASDVANNLPTAVALACDDKKIALDLSAKLSGPAFRVYASNDLKGVELGGALKNVIALAIGVCRGLNLGASAEAALIARGFAELNRLAITLGARPETMMGLSGLGDLVLTCSSPQSRNFSYGMALGRGENRTNLPLAEGAFTASIAHELAEKHGIDCPIIKTVVTLLTGSITAGEAVKSLLSRPLKIESE